MHKLKIGVTYTGSAYAPEIASFRVGPIMYRRRISTVEWKTDFLHAEKRVTAGEILSRVTSPYKNYVALSIEEMPGILSQLQMPGEWFEQAEKDNLDGWSIPDLPLYIATLKAIGTLADDGRRHIPDTQANVAWSLQNLLCGDFNQSMGPDTTNVVMTSSVIERIEPHGEHAVINNPFHKGENKSYFIHRPKYEQDYFRHCWTRYHAKSIDKIVLAALNAGVKQDTSRLPIEQFTWKNAAQGTDIEYAVLGLHQKEFPATISGDASPVLVRGVKVYRGDSVSGESRPKQKTTHINVFIADTGIPRGFKSCGNCGTSLEEEAPPICPSCSYKLKGDRVLNPEMLPGGDS